MKELENILHYNFSNKKLLEEALIHPSISKEYKNRKLNYERLEFLGDGVLGLVIAEMLMDKYPEECEGSLAKRQAGLVRGETVAQIADDLSIGRFIEMTKGEENMGGRKNRRNIENALEAIIGAIYKDSNYETARDFVIKHWIDIIEKMKEPPKDFKTKLQEWAQSEGYPTPYYEIIDATGPAHAPEFKVKVIVEGVGDFTEIGSSKKKAEKLAAERLYKKIHHKKDCDE